MTSPKLKPQAKTVDMPCTMMQDRIVPSAPKKKAPIPAKKTKQALLQEVFDAQKPLSKTELRKVTPGTWVEVKYGLRDGNLPNRAMLVLETPPRGIGSVTVYCFDPVRKDCEYRTESDQIVRVLGKLEVPTLQTKKPTQEQVMALAIKGGIPNKKVLEKVKKTGSVS